MRAAKGVGAGRDLSIALVTVTDSATQVAFCMDGRRRKEVGARTTCANLTRTGVMRGSVLVSRRDRLANALENWTATGQTPTRGQDKTIARLAAVMTDEWKFGAVSGDLGVRPGARITRVVQCRTIGMMMFHGRFGRRFRRRLNSGIRLLRGGCSWLSNGPSPRSIWSR